jgi:hypothetical protein
MTAAPFYAEDAPIGVGVEEPAPKPQWETEPSGQRSLADEAEHGWTPVLLQFGGWEDFGDPPEPQPDVYGFGLGVFSVAAHDVVGAELALGCPFAQQAWGVQAGFIGAGAVCMNGIQAGGVMAGAERLDGVALSGVMAGAERLDGVALSGLFAFAETGHGIVASLGFTDTGNAIALANAPLKPFTGIQLAGIANFASDITGVQLATVFNFAGELHGLQIGLFNRALSGRGVQLGLVNSFGRDDDVRSIPLLNARF